MRWFRGRPCGKGDDLRCVTRLFSVALSLLVHSAFAQDTAQVFWSGALTPHSLRVNVRVNAITDSVRLVVCEAPCNGDQQYSAYTVADSAHDFVAALEMNGLIADRPYSYRFEVNGALDTSSTRVGRFTTPRDGPASYAFVVGSCNSNGAHPVWQAMRDKHPLFFLNIGDLHYRDPNSTDIDVHRDPYRVDVLSRSPMKDLLHDMPIAYVWDDHDFCGNGSDAGNTGRANAARAYRDYVPHYPLHDPIGVHQSFTIGRVRFILSDLRSGKSPASMMDIEQFLWLQDEFRYARDHQLIAAWVSPLTWNSVDFPENWGSQPAERQAIADFLYNEGVENLFIMCGDAHMLAIDDGANADFSTAQSHQYHYPILQAAAIARGGSYKGGTFNQGGYFPNPDLQHGQFGEVIVDDDGEQVCITFKGWRTDSMSANVTLINSYTFCRTPPMVGISELENGSTASSFVRDGMLELRWPDRTGPGEVELLDMTGRTLTKRSVQWSNGQTRLALPSVAQEIVIARITAIGHYATLRIFIP